MKTPPLFGAGEPRCSPWPTRPTHTQTPTNSLSFPADTQRNTKHGVDTAPSSPAAGSGGEPPRCPQAGFGIHMQNHWGNTERRVTASSLKDTSLHLGLAAVRLLLPSHGSDATQRTKANKPMSKAKSNPRSPANTPKPMLALFQLTSLCFLRLLNHFPTLSQLKEPQHNSVLLLPGVQSVKTKGQPCRAR